MSDGAPKSVTVDSDRCCFHYLCVDVCPEVFYIDPVTEQAAIRPDAERWFEVKASDIRLAAAACPTDAILVNGQSPETPD